MVQISQARLSDLEGIVSLLSKNGLYLGEASEEWVPLFLVAKSDGTVIGCIKHKVSESGIFELKSLAVDKAYRRQKIATRLTMKKIEEARTLGYDLVYIRILKTNTHSRALAKKLGFKEIPQEGYTVFNSCSKCLPDFKNKNQYCIEHSEEGEDCPIVAYKLTNLSK